MSLSIAEIKRIAKTITNEKQRVHYNSILQLLGEFDVTVANQTLLQDEDETYEQKQRFLAVALFQIFKKLFTRHELKPLSAKLQATLSQELVKFNQWCRKCYTSYKSKILSVIRNLTIETSLALDCLDLYMQLLELEATHLAPNSSDPYFPAQTLSDLVDALWSSNIENSEIDPTTGQSTNFILLEFVEKYYKKFVDIQYYFQLEFNHLSDLDEKSHPKKLNGELGAAKWLAITNHDCHITNTEAVDLEVFVENPPQAVENEQKFRTLLEQNWLYILGGELTVQQYKTILLITHKRIVPHFLAPTKLMDFLTAAYNLQMTNDQDGSGVIPLLALNGLFELMKSFNLEYPNFYEKLYQLLTPSLMHVKYRPRFFRLMELFLSSTHLSAHLVASFIKRLARLSLSAPPGAIVSIFPFIYNLLKKHPNCMVMIHNPKYLSDPFDGPERRQELRTLRAQYVDPFDMSEPNPELTHALDSSLWELQTLANHYHPNVAALGRIFSQPFRKLHYNMEDFLDWSYDSLLKAEATRKLKVLPTLEFETFDLVLSSGESEQKVDEDGTDAVESSKSVYLQKVVF